MWVPDRMLETVCLVQDNNGIFYILNSDLVDLNHPVVVHVLNIKHDYYWGSRRPLSERSSLSLPFSLAVRAS